MIERLLCNPITLEAAPPWQWCAHTQDLTEVSETGRARNASYMTNEETEVRTGETIAQGRFTTRGEARTEATRTSTFSLGVLVSSTASKGTVPVATTTTLPTCAMAPGYKPPFCVGL